MMKYNGYIIALLFLCFLQVNRSLSQQINYYSDCFSGGVTGGGYNPGLTNNIGFISVHIPPNSTIRRAFLFATAMKYSNQANFPQSKDIIINDSLIHLGIGNALNNEYLISFQGSLIYYNSLTTVNDITNELNINSILTINGITLNPNGQSTDLPCFAEYYILLLYENISMPKTCVDVFVNNQNAEQSMNYFLSPSLAIDYSYDVGLSLNTADICNTFQDGSFVNINSNPIGLIGGSEYNSSIFCSSPSGNFYYENNILSGLTDDTSDSLMSETDALANIKSYGANNPINVNFSYQTPQYINAAKTNGIDQLFLVYSTPCSPINATVSKDTTICQGQQLQLHATGGQKYEWQSVTSTTSTGLSCTDCPNPIFSGDSSRVYTVRIRSNDSCSVVRPVRITVLPKPKVGNFKASDTRCSVPSSGVIQLLSATDMAHFYAINEQGDTLVNNGQYITNLPAGKYTVYYTNASGCKCSDTILIIGYQKEATANFTVVPNSGAAPLSVQITNTSQNDTGFKWTLNGVSTGTTPPTIFDTSGTYQIQLIAWNTDPHCADTITKTVLVYDSLLIEIPNVFTPNNDGVNDVFTITSNLQVQAKIHIFNRWGNEVFVFDKTLSIGSNVIWDGTSNGKQVSDGTYFYKATFTLDSSQADCEKQLCTIEKSGFLTVVR